MELSKCLQDAELAYQILLDAGKTIYFREIITQILASSNATVFSQAQAMTEVHTQNIIWTAGLSIMDRECGG